MLYKTNGLSHEQVIARQQKSGKNELPASPPPNAISLILDQLKSPLIYVLLIASLVTSLIGHLKDAIIIASAVLLNTILGFVQEYRAGNALQALSKYLKSHSTVIRDSKEQEVLTTELVVGDSIVLHQGDRVGADSHILFANRAYLNESLLTGESLPLAKEVGDPVYMGTIVASGQVVARVTHIAGDTKMGAIASDLDKKSPKTPLQRQLAKFSTQILYLVAALTLFVFGLGLIKGIGVEELFITSVALAVSSIPEGLIISLTIVLAVGMQKMAKYKGLVRKLSAAETLGGVTVICLDKTGTLTTGEMSVASHYGDPSQLSEQVVVANDLDDPLVIEAHRWGSEYLKKNIPEYKRLDSIPFSSENKFFASLHAQKNKHMLYVSGAPEVLLDFCLDNKRDKAAIKENIEQLTASGHRVIGYATKALSTSHNKLNLKDVKGGLNWVGMLAFIDPVRLSVKSSLEQARLAGIRTIVITGDYAPTARAVLSKLDITITQGEIITGEELERLSATELKARIKGTKLFARTTPSQKSLIVQALKDSGEVVAMMGDGVNDAPALHQADIGVVVGSATDVARESADLVLLDSNFGTIIKAIEQGRIMFDNIRKIILYLLSDAFTEIVVVIVGILCNLPLPVTALQILWINLVSDGFPSMALTIDPGRAKIMQMPPRPPQEPLVTKWMVALIALVSLVSGILAFGYFYLTYVSTEDAVFARSVTFLTLGINSLAYVFSVRLLTTPFWQDNIFKNKPLIWAVILGFALQALPFATPLMREFFGVVALGPAEWAIAVTLSLSVFFVIEIAKYIFTLWGKKTVTVPRQLLPR